MSKTLLVDATAAVIAVILTAGIIGLIGFGRAVPGELWQLAGVSFGWLFRASVNGVKNGGISLSRTTPPPGGTP